jgi:zinc finger protein
LGITIEPGPLSEGYISNIEGLLDRIEAVTKALLESKGAEEFLKKLKNARNAAFDFEVVIEDPLGNSALIGTKVSKQLLSKKEIDNLSKRPN